MHADESLSIVMHVRQQIFLLFVGQLHLAGAVDEDDGVELGEVLAVGASVALADPLVVGAQVGVPHTGFLAHVAKRHHGVGD